MNDQKRDVPENISFEELRKRPDLSLGLAHGICGQHRLSSDCTKITEGSQLLFSSAGCHVIKIFSPQDVEFFRNETIFLTNLHQRSPIQTPQLVASGSFGVYPYIIMGQLQGTPLKHVWTELSESERSDIISQFGEIVRAFHALPIELFDAAPFKWHSLIEHQRDALLANHRGYGLGEEWVAQLLDYVNGCPLDLHDPLRLVPLHTELMQEHILVKKIGTQWTLSGLVDFEPSMVGHVEYEFCSVGLFLTRGNRNLFRLFLSSYGYRGADLTDQLSRRIMALMLLHRYSNLKRFFTLLPAGAEFTNLSQLEQYWYGF